MPSSMIPVLVPKPRSAISPSPPTPSSFSREGNRWLVEDGFGSPGGLNGSGDQAWFNILQGRGKPGALGPAALQTAFAPWGGSVAFDNSSTAWYFGADPSGIQSNQTDFL